MDSSAINFQKEAMTRAIIVPRDAMLTDEQRKSACVDFSRVEFREALKRLYPLAEKMLPTLPLNPENPPPMSLPSVAKAAVEHLFTTQRLGAWGENRDSYSPLTDIVMLREYMKKMHDPGFILFREEC